MDNDIIPLWKVDGDVDINKDIEVCRLRIDVLASRFRVG